MKELLKKYKNKAPEIVFNWKGPEAKAKGKAVINFLQGGAGSGTRM